MCRETINDLTTAGLTYPCTCSRRTIRESGAQRGRAGLIYRGTCREGHPPDPETAASVRVLTRDAVINFTDALQGPQSCRLSAEIGDFMIRRADGLVAYQLAVTVDDHNQGITEVVRGIDLLDSTFMQIHLQHLLGLATPQYMHVPVVTTDTHDKLSKQTGAPPVDPDKAVKNIYQALVFLEQNPEPSLLGATLREIWRWAEAHWNPANLSGLKQKQYRSMILR